MGLARAAFTAPIPGDAPSGAWLRREGTYAAVQEARREDPGDAAYGIPEKRADWPEVVSLCTEALTSRTKDFYLACCLLEGLTHTEGAQGLADGIWFVAELHDKFWDDFYPQPRDEGTNLDGRLNQLEEFVSTMGRALGALPMSEGSVVISRLDWEFAGQKLPSGDTSPWTEDHKREALQSSPWDFYDGAVRALKEAKAELLRLDDLVEKYPRDAPSLVAAKDGLNETAGLFERLLVEKGPSPYLEQARQAIAQAAAGFLDEDWLAAHIRSGISYPMILESVQAAGIDNATGTVPEQGWQPLLEGLWQKGERYEAKSEPVAPAGTTEASAGDPSAPAGPVVVAPSGPVSGKDGAATVISTCRALRRADPGNPIPYLVTRLIRWRELDALDRASPPPAPSSGKRDQCTALFQGERWPELLELCESTLESGDGVTWLDMQRYACAAMGQIGAPYGPARAAILRNLADLLRRHRWLEEATLADARPSADDITKNWLSAEVGSAGGDSGSGGGGGPAPRDDAHLARATEILEQEGIEEALGHLQKAMAAAPNQRERALRMQDLGLLCVQAERPDLAVPVLERLRSDIRKRSLDDWEGPDFLSRTLETLYRSYTLIESTSPSEEVSARKRAVADELAQVDLNRWLRLGGSLT